ncbi:MAG: ATP-binding cassette domain-containing protein [Rickettsiaceae bacterium]|nr:ATP-binding cassette domain-containing protein [Rickettsiaceae bacterium]
MAKDIHYLFNSKNFNEAISTAAAGITGYTIGGRDAACLMTIAKMADSTWNYYYPENSNNNELKSEINAENDDLKASNNFLTTSLLNYFLIKPAGDQFIIKIPATYNHPILSDALSLTLGATASYYNTNNPFDYSTRIEDSLGRIILINKIFDPKNVVSWEELANISNLLTTDPIQAVRTCANDVSEAFKSPILRHTVKSYLWKATITIAEYYISQMLYKHTLSKIFDQMSSNTEGNNQIILNKDFAMNKILIPYMVRTAINITQAIISSKFSTNSKTLGPDIENQMREKFIETGNDHVNANNLTYPYDNAINNLENLCTSSLKQILSLRDIVVESKVLGSILVVQKCLESIYTNYFLPKLDKVLYYPVDEEARNKLDHSKKSFIWHKKQIVANNMQDLIQSKQENFKKDASIAECNNSNNQLIKSILGDITGTIKLPMHLLTYLYLSDNNEYIYDITKIQQLHSQFNNWLLGKSPSNSNEFVLNFGLGEEMIKFLQEFHNKQKIDNAQHEVNKNGELILKDYSLSIQDDKGNINRNLMKDINFKFEKGKIYAIVAGTVSGKSSLISDINKSLDKNKISTGIISHPEKTMIINQKAYFGFNLTWFETIALKNENEMTLDEALALKHKIYEIALELDFRKIETNKKSFKEFCKEFLDLKVPGSFENQNEQVENVISGGQEKQVLIMRLLMIEDKPELLILDELLTGLDYKSGIKAQEKIKDHLKDCTILVVDHVAYANKNGFYNKVWDLLDTSKISCMDFDEYVKNCNINKQNDYQEDDNVLSIDHDYYNVSNKLIPKNEKLEIAETTGDIVILFEEFMSS